VIDTEVVDSPGKEFYLISQNARQGTVNPTKFEIVHPNVAPTRNNFTRIQATTFALTHMYYNWPSQIKVPAPCQYANKLATLVGEHMKMDSFLVPPSLDNKLFYL
jgi:aubergine-like protein